MELWLGAGLKNKRTAVVMVQRDKARGMRISVAVKLRWAYLWKAVIHFEMQLWEKKGIQSRGVSD